MSPGSRSDLTLKLHAVIHATWNLINKQASGHATFALDLVAVLSAFFYAPATIAIIEIWQLKFSFVEIGMMAGSAALHTGYFCFSIKHTGSATCRWFIRWRAALGRCCRPSRRLYFSANGLQ